MFLRLLPKIPLFTVARARGVVPPLPVSLTVSVLYACNSRCLTCNVYERKVQTLDLDEYQKIFSGMGDGLIWVTLSGGEPTLRKDLPDIASIIVDTVAPEVLNLPTNGIMSERILDQVDRISAMHPGQFIVNLSLDAIGERHDEIRATPGNWDDAMVTYRGLKDLQRKHKNLLIGIHTVVSKHNVDDFPSICDELLTLDPDSYITEVAEERVELLTLGMDITPRAESYRRAMAHLSQRMDELEQRGTARLIRAIRTRYYDYVQDYLERPREVWPCYAGVMSAHLMPDGKLWACGIRGDEMGDLRTADYDFPGVWAAAQSAKARAAIKNERCHCPMANMTYTNMLANVPALAQIGVNLVKGLPIAS